MFKFKEIIILVLSTILTVFNVSGQTLSPKRGIAGDLLDNNDCSTVQGYMTWFYNWANTPNAGVINTSQNYIEFAPMLWNGSWNSTNINNYLSAHPEVKYILTFNEPNLTGQANMTPAQAASYWPQIETIANTYNLKIVGPAMTYCPSGCISGYTGSGITWLDDFFAACPSCRVDYIALHIYDTWLYGFEGNVGNATTGYKKYGKPIWITEFAEQALNSATVAQHANLMVDAIDYMETDPMIYRYAWFLARSSPSTNTEDILGQTTGTYTDLGLIYSHMSSYDKNYYHSVNNIIEAEYYIDKSVIYYNCTTPCIPFCANSCWWYSVLLEKTTDGAGGVLDAYNFNSANDTVYYNVDIPTTQTYSIDFRVNSTAASTFAVHNAAGTVLGTTGSLNTAGAWSTINLSGINLSAGKQKIYLTATNGSALKLNWLRINCSSNCGTLPVAILDFEAKKISDNAVKLDWETSVSKNNNEFFLERSVDGIQFDVIDSMEAIGNDVNPTELYTYTDIHTQAYQDVYYRLKQVDQNSASSYSEIIKVTYENNSIRLSGTTIVSHLSSDCEINYMIMSQLGQILEQGTYQGKKGSMEKSISSEKLASGVILSESLRMI